MCVFVIWVSRPFKLKFCKVPITVNMLSCVDSSCVMCCREDGDQDGEVGEMEGSNNNNSPGLLSHGPGKLESPLPPQSSLDLDKQGKTLIKKQ